MQASDMILRKSASVTDTGINGGVIGFDVIQSANKHALFPIISPSDRATVGGLVRKRKFGVCNVNSNDEIGYNVNVFFDCPSNGEDSVSFHLGNQSNIQSELTGYEKKYGCGTLSGNLVGGETSLSLIMESDDVGFAPGGYLFLHNHFMVGQTVDDGTIAGLPKVRAGESCEFSADAWRRRAFSSNVTYPYGKYLGSGVVYTQQATSKQQLIRLKEYKTTDAVLATAPAGNTNTQLTLTNLVPGNGIEESTEYQAVLKATCGSTERTVTVNGDGSCSGYCVAGTLALETGVWTVQIDWVTAPDENTDITVTYYTKAYTNTGNTYTLELENQVSNPYSSGLAYGAGVMSQDELTTSFDTVVLNSTNGVFDYTTTPLTLYNIGTPEDTLTFVFISGAEYNLTSIRYGSLGTGNVASDFTVLNTDTGTNMLTVPSDIFSGTYQAGDTITLKTHPAILPIWMEQSIPEGMAIVEDDDHWMFHVMFSG